MELELGNARRPIRELRKSLRSLHPDPPTKDVHNLRTRSRQLEAISIALMARDKQCTRSLLKALKPVRKAAGGVRDMDVLTAKVLTLGDQLSDDSVKRLLEYLQSQRIENASELLEAVAKHRKEACRRLDRFSKQIELRFHEKNPSAGAAMSLIGELNRWPPLNPENLHDFRGKIKELRYVLQLAEEVNPTFVNALEMAKEQIGDWHDWWQLEQIAAKVLDPTKDRIAIEKIAKVERKELSQALNAAHALKMRCLGSHSGLAMGEP